MPIDAGLPYRVVYSEQKRRPISQAAIGTKLLRQQGHERQALAAALDQLDHQLRTRPHEAGEAHFHLGALGWLMSYAFNRPFGFEFAIVEEAHVVFIRRVFRMTEPTA